MSEEEVQYDTSWDSQQLCDHLLQYNVITNDEYIILRDQRIDGLTFLLMKENNLRELGLLLGPKIKILNFIQNIKHQIEVNSDFNESQIKTESETGGGDVAKEDDQKEVKESTPKRSYQCSDCGKSYSKRQYVRDHKRTTHYNSRDNYSCRVCGQAFGWRVTVLKHIKKRHPEKNTTAMIDQLF